MGAPSNAEIAGIVGGSDGTKGLVRLTKSCTRHGLPSSRVEFGSDAGYVLRIPDERDQGDCDLRLV